MQHLSQKLLEYSKQNLLREYKAYNANTIDFTSSDYLGLANSKNLKYTIISSFDKYGLGSKGSNAVCGYTKSTKTFENIFAKFTGYPSAIFIGSGYMANLAIYATLFAKNNTIFTDKNIHASTIDGIKLSQAKLKRFKHQDFEHLTNIYDKNSFVVSEGIFSTNGSLTNLQNLSKISNKLIIDEAHSLGIIGNMGKGSLDYHQLSYQDCPIAIFPLGKAFGSFGAMICTTQEIANFLRQFARNYIYTTALPPLLIDANITQLENLKKANEQREKLHDNIRYFNKISYENNLNCNTNALSPIKSIILDSNSKALEIRHQLEHKNISISCFRYPTVPKNTPMLRLSLHNYNTHKEIYETINIITKNS